MKNQYVGDINDYFKYALLRSIESEGVGRLLVCWMLTPDDGGTDGRRRKYLSEPAKFRGADPWLFDELRHLTGNGQPCVADVQAAGVFDDAVFVERLLGDTKADRDSYFQEVSSLLRPGDTVFFDPDNGLDVKSVPKGRKNSAKYVYVDELASVCDSTRSVIVYQHFGRVPRAQYLQAQLQRIGDALPDREVFAIAGTHVAFLAACARGHWPRIRRGADGLCRRWPNIQLVD
ncbi:MAG TPA: hypothetical protein VF712_18825 [Thermoleophilaceae bacterium]